MILGCYEISKSVIVKHMQNIGIIRAFCLPGGLVKFFNAFDRKNCSVEVC